MNFKELGKTGVRVPEIGLGTWKYRGGIEPLRKGLSLGATLIDTAEMYGTEGIVGEAVKGRREKVFLATKVSGNHLGYRDVLAAAEKSLKRLETNAIDLYQIHWPDPHTPIRETMRALEELIAAGKVKYVGVSNFSVSELQEAQEALRKHAIVSNQVEYSLLDRKIEEDLLPYCERHGITIIAYTPLGQGELTKTSFWQRRRALQVLGRVALEARKTMAQTALNWCISKPRVIAIPKSDSAERTGENCGASGWSLSAEQMEALNRAFR